MIVVDLHKAGDGDQELTCILRDPVKVFRELIADPRASGSQYLGYRELRDATGSRIFYHSNGSLNYQEAQIRAGSGLIPVSVKIYIDATFGKSHMEYRPVYSKSSNYYCFDETYVEI